ncbi:MAG: PAS domain S-box protein [Deltaproteobacteria bacterium]|nr:PAS domain S-box protein [Deltaproteobacteria bacterium]
MGSFELNSQGGGLRQRLLVIEALVFVLPFLVVFYFLYENKISLRYDQLLLFAFILLLILAGLMILRQVFDSIEAIAAKLRKTLASDETIASIKQDADELHAISVSFNRLMDRFQATSDQLNRRVFELLSIKELTEVAIKSLDMDALLSSLLEKAAAVSGAQMGSVLMLEPQNQCFRVKATEGQGKEPAVDATIEFKDTLAQLVLESKSALLVEDIETDPRINKSNNPKYNTPSFLIMPLVIKNRIVGVLNLACKQTGQTFNSNDQQVLSIMMNEIGFALENAQLHAKVASQYREIRKQAEILNHANHQLKQQIIEKRKTEKALRESEARYRLLVENANDGIFITQDGFIKFPNPKMTALVGYSESQLKSVEFSSIIHPEDRHWVVDRQQRMLDQEDSSSTYSFRIQDKWGNQLWVDVNTVAVKWEGKHGVLNFMRDVTKQKKLEAQFYQAQKMEAIGTLAGGIAHEFNNLLMGIQGNTQLMLLDTEFGKPHRERLKNIERLVKKGAILTKQLLGFARGGKYEVHTTDLNTIIRRTMDIFHRTRKEIQTHLKIQKDLWSVEADPSQIEQVLMNLYVNASQAMPNGGLLSVASENLELERKAAEPLELVAGSYVKISVTDTGVGMDEITRRRIFEPFFTTQQMGRGSGLGLAAVYGIVKNHGGAIDVQSQEGKGTSFHIYLPALSMRATEEKKTSNRIEKGRGMLLVVDDEEMILDVSKQMLEKLGYRVLTAKSLKEAIDIFAEHKDRIDGVVLDMIMPGASGGMVYERLKEMNPQVRVLLSSGYSMDDKAKEILNKGAAGFIQKPFNIQLLSQKIKEILSSR